MSDSKPMHEKEATPAKAKPKTQTTYEKLKQESPDQALKEQISTLEQTITALQQELEESKAAVQKQKIQALADYKNQQDLHTKEKNNIRDYATTAFAKSLLDVADAVEQGIKTSQDSSQKEGLDLIWRSLQSVFKQNHIERLDPKGNTYDPHHHEAMAMQPSESAAHHEIIQVIQSGYKLKDRLLRPARVIVCKNDK